MVFSSFFLSGPPLAQDFFLSVPDVEYSWRSLLMTSERRETWPCRRHGCGRYRKPVNEKWRQFSLTIFFKARGSFFSLLSATKFVIMVIIFHACMNIMLLKYL